MQRCGHRGSLISLMSYTVYLPTVSPGIGGFRRYFPGVERYCGTIYSICLYVNFGDDDHTKYEELRSVPLSRLGIYFISKH